MNSFRSLNPKQNLIINIIIIAILLILTIILFYYIYTNQDKIMRFFKPIDFNDKTAPTLTEVTIKSDNKINSKYAEESNTITLQFKASEELKNLPKVKINDTDVNVYFRNNYYVAYYTILEQTSSNILVTFEIANLQDNNGNKGKDVLNTTDQSSVTIVPLGTSIATLQ